MSREPTAAQGHVRELLLRADGDVERAAWNVECCESLVEHGEIELARHQAELSEARAKLDAAEQVRDALVERFPEAVEVPRV